MKKTFVILILASMTQVCGFTQSDVDAYRYARTFQGGTARFMAMGGAFGSLGADFSTSSTNPAGLGLYTMSEVTVTPSLYFGRTVSDFNGISSYDSKSNFNLGNAGIVMASPPRSKKNTLVKNYQFSFGVNRVNNFNNRVLMEGFNTANSIVDTYVDDANGIYYADIEDNYKGYYAYDLNPAWYTYMIDTLPGFDDQYYGAVPYGSDVLQRKEVYTWGSMNEMILAFSVNFSDRVYLGATFGFPFLRYFEESFYTETDRNNEINDFDRLIIYENLATRGSGFNIKFGTIVRATDFLRLGGAIHSPTWYNNMRDEWYSEFGTYFDNGESFNERTPYGSYDYQLETPWKALGSFAFIIKGMALVSAEYEYMDFTKSKLSSPGYSFYDENSAIRSKYAKSHTFKLGSEVRFGPFSVRGGGGYLTSPFVDDINEGDRFYFSGGAGFRDKNFFLDLAYVQTISHEDYYFYGSENVAFQPVKNKYSTYNIMLTGGFRF